MLRRSLVLSAFGRSLAGSLAPTCLARRAPGPTSWAPPAPGQTRDSCRIRTRLLSSRSPCLQVLVNRDFLSCLSNDSKCESPQPGYLDSSESSRSSTATHSRTSSEGVTPPYAVLPNNNTANNQHARGQNQVKLEPSGSSEQQLAAVWRKPLSSIFTSIPPSSAIPRKAQD